MRSRREFWILLVFSAVLLAAPLRTGDLAGYDDAQYAHIAKDMVKSGQFLDVRSSGNLSFEHPPMFEWMQAALFEAGGFTDRLARLPSAICGWGVILLVYWLARRLTGDPLNALLAMIAMTGSLYFLKYAARAMTDVPFTFFFLCAMCAWTLAEDQPRWYAGVAVAIACAQMTRSLMGLSLPAIFLLHAWVAPRRTLWRYAAPALALGCLPLIAWYARALILYRDLFLARHNGWLAQEVYGPLTPAWRRYTGAFEYLWMLAKSYWPWLPAMLAGIVYAARRKERKFYLLLVWIATVFALCAVTRSRVLRYMLPAYPAFAVLAGLGLVKFLPERVLRSGARVCIGLIAAGACIISLFPRTHLEATEVRPVAVAATKATPPGERVVFYDHGQPRYDEANQMEWYGDRFLIWPANQEELLAQVAKHPAPVMVLDSATAAALAATTPYRELASSGHLVCIRVCKDGLACPADAE